MVVALLIFIGTALDIEFKILVTMSSLCSAREPKVVKS